MLVGGTHQAEFVALLQTVLDRALPDARPHVVEVVVVARVALGQSVTREHLDERRLPVLTESCPVVTAESGHIAHVVGRNVAVVLFEPLLEVGNRGALDQRGVEAVEQRHVIAVLHAVTFVGGEGQEFARAVGRPDGRQVFVIAPGTQAPERLGVVADDPVQARVVLARNVGPQGVGRHRDEIQLLFGRGKGVREVAVSVGHVAVVVHVAPEDLEALERRESLFQVAGQRIPVTQFRTSGNRLRSRQAEQGPARSLQKISPIHIIINC